MSYRTRAFLLVAIFALGLRPWARAPARASALGIDGFVWYDDNPNGTRDRGEEPAGGVRVYIMAGEYGPHGHQPTLVAQAISDESGHFHVSFDATIGESVKAMVSWAYRPGYPYSAEPMAVPPPADWVGYNYTSGMIPVALHERDRMVVEVPLNPLRGVLERLAPGSPPDFTIPGGHFFTQTNGLRGGSAVGFSVTDTDGIPFWSTWVRLGLENAGYPLSSRFVWAGYPIQVFQKVVLQWQPPLGLCLLNLYDEFHDAGFDPWLWEHEATPLQLEPEFDAGKNWGQIVRDRLRLLDANAAIMARYFAAPDPVLLYGLPTSRIQELGDVIVLRTQRTTLQLWTVDTGWAKAGEVTPANGGEIALELGLFPYGQMFDPMTPPSGAHVQILP